MKVDLESKINLKQVHDIYNSIGFERGYYSFGIDMYKKFSDKFYSSVIEIIPKVAKKISVEEEIKS